jgi:hypothetical protein
MRPHRPKPQRPKVKLLKRGQVLRLTAYVLVLFVVVAMLVRLARHRNPPPVRVDTHTVAAAASASPDEPAAAADSESTETQILAACEPHLGPNSALVPNIDVSQAPNPAALRLKVRFWVSGDGFVNQAEFVGDSVVSAEDKEAELHYTKGLSFSVPGTPECGARQIELIGNFAEQKGPTGEWSTVFNVHPRYSLVGKRVVEKR